MISNTDLTVFHRTYNPVAHSDSWDRIYIKKAWWKKDSKSIVSIEGMSSNDTYTVRIEDMTVEISKEDVLVKGDVKSYKDGSEKFIVKGVNYNNYGLNPHIKVVG